MDKQELLAKIMWKDEELKTKGITVKADGALLSAIQNRLLHRLAVHSDPDFLGPWIMHLYTQSVVHRTETFTNEPDATGASRTGPFHMANNFFKYGKNFVHPPSHLEFTGPPTAVVAVTDASGQRTDRVLVAVENKRPKVCSDEDLEAIIPPHGTSITIKVENESGKPNLVWINAPQHGRLFIAQVC